MFQVNHDNFFLQENNESNRVVMSLKVRFINDYEVNHFRSKVQDVMFATVLISLNDRDGKLVSIRSTGHSSGEEQQVFPVKVNPKKKTRYTKKLRCQKTS